VARRLQRVRVNTAGDYAERVPTSALSAAGLIAGFAVAMGTGSRPLGGVVLAAFGLSCIYVWLRRDDRRTAIRLTIVGLAAFVISHGLGLVIGPWPSVFIVAALTAWACWRFSDARWLGRGAQALDVGAGS
jgi:Flp pilus assembly protein TadB